MTQAAPLALTRARLFAVGGAASLVPLNSTMIAVVLPRIADDFDTSVGRTSVLVTVYLVVMLFGQPVAGRICDRFGATRTVEAALIGFAGASLAASFAPVFELLVVARVGQAIFGATLVPGAQAIIRAAAPPQDRGRLFGLLGSMLGIGAASGPLIGGLLVDAFGWRSIFVINLPVVAFSLIARLPNRSLAVSPPVADHELRSSLARKPVFVAAFVVQALSTLGQYMLLLVAPIVLDARGWSSAAVGVALSGLTIGLIVMGPLGGRTGDRRGRRRPAMAGLAVCAVALTGATAQGAAIAPAPLLIALTAFGFGLGFALPSVQTAGLEVIHAHRTGAAAGVLSMSRYVGSITTSLLVAAWLSTDGSGAQPALGVASIAAVAALAAATRLPTAPAPADYAIAEM